MSTAIKIENVSKQYRLGVISTGTLSHDLNRWWTTRILRKEDPYLKIGSVNDRSQKADSEYVWALKDINMEIEQGDVVGIIGKNGAGKSTLLKLLSRVTKPTTGSIKYKGRIASLLEVGTGFHPEMTGRENIYMNGAIMGMTKQEITRKLDEIVDFSGCERYIDTPVKRYSSGMTVRLGFAIAAHLDPEILVVDEVLAVGDAEFQKKAIGKMQDVSKGEGRTVLFVSHNMAAVKSLCKKGIVLNNGSIAFNGTTDDAIDFYIQGANCQEYYKKILDSVRTDTDYVSIKKIMINGTDDFQSVIKSNQEYMDLYIEGIAKRSFLGNIKMKIKTKEGIPLAALAESTYKGLLINFEQGDFLFKRRLKLPKYINAGDCKIDLLLYNKSLEYFRADDCAAIHINGSFDELGLPLNVRCEGLFGFETI